jgi:thiol-disulfide isomerase/thioredoxin
MAVVSRLAAALVAVLIALPQSAAAEGTPQGFAIQEPSKPLPEIAFQDGDGKPRTLGDFRGKVVLLNIWATWCAPCRKEMPTLDRLQAQLAGSDFQVVALSMDRAGPDVVKKFFAEIGVRNLALEIDPSSKAMFALGVFGLPTTVLIDRKGQEIGRLVGPAEWDAPKMLDFIRSEINQERNLE